MKEARLDEDEYTAQCVIHVNNEMRRSLLFFQRQEYGLL